MIRLRAKRAQLYTASFLVDAIGHAFPLVMALRARHVYQASALDLGFLGMAWTAVYAAVCFLAGGLSDRLGSSRLFRAGLILLSLVVGPFAVWAQGLAQLYLVNALFGLGLAFFWPPLQRELSFLSPGRTLWTSLGAFNLAWAAGSSFGTWLGGPSVYADLGFTPLAFAASGIILLALISTLGRWTAPGHARVEISADAAAIDAPVDPARATLFLHLGRVANFCSALAMAGTHAVFVDVALRLGLSAGSSALILIAKEAGRFVAFTLLRSVSAWHYSLAWLVALQAAGALALLAGGATADPTLLAIVFFILGLFSGLAYYSSIYYALNLRAAEGRKSAVHEGILALGAVLGPFACGVAGDLFPAWPGGVLASTGLLLLGGCAVELGMARVASANRSWPAPRGGG